MADFADNRQYWGHAFALLRHAEGPGMAAIEPWLEAAELRLSADAALSELSAMAMSVAASRDE